MKRRIAVILFVLFTFCFQQCSDESPSDPSSNTTKIKTQKKSAVYQTTRDFNQDVFWFIYDQWALLSIRFLQEANPMEMVADTHFFVNLVQTDTTGTRYKISHKFIENTQGNAFVGFPVDFLPILDDAADYFVREDSLDAEVTLNAGNESLQVIAGDFTSNYAIKEMLETPVERGDSTWHLLNLNHCSLTLDFTPDGNLNLKSASYEGIYQLADVGDDILQLSLVSDNGGTPCPDSNFLETDFYRFLNYSSLAVILVSSDHDFSTADAVLFLSTTEY